MRVSLVGAGPGDAGLLTLKGAERISQADVVLYDRFVGSSILALIPESAERIDVGKHAGNHPVPQDQINRLLLEKAELGLNVVRLKGGDPFVFGRGGEELELLEQASIPFEVVPGVTSAIAGPAYAGIPVTHRDYASSVHFITSQAKDHRKPQINYPALVQAGGTLVFLMGVSTLPSICEGCLAAGMDKNMPAAVIENASFSSQRKFIGTVTTLPALAQANQVVSPALIVIGQVAGLSERFDWFSALPLHGRRVVVPRVKPGQSKLAHGLREQGAEVIELRTAVLRAVPKAEAMIADALERIDSYGWLVLTSEYGANLLFSLLRQAAFDIRRLAHLKVATVGPETERALNQLGIQVDYRPGQYNGAALAEGLAELAAPGERALVVRAVGGAAQLAEVLEQRQVGFDELAIYQRLVPDGLASYPTSGLAGGTPGGTPASQPAGPPEFDYAAFASSSAVEGFAQAMPGLDLSTVQAFCIGQMTAEKARSLGMRPHLANQSTINSLIDELIEVNSHAS